MKAYIPLMKFTEDQVTEFLTIDEAKNFIRRVRNVNFFIGFELKLPVENREDGEYKVPVKVDVSARQIQVILNQIEMFNAQDPRFPDGKIPITRFKDFVYVG